MDGRMESFILLAGCVFTAGNSNTDDNQIWGL
jgi:hypothetical protein